MRLPRQRFAAPNQALFQAYGFVLRIARRPVCRPKSGVASALCGGSAGDYLIKSRNRKMKSKRRKK